MFHQIPSVRVPLMAMRQWQGAPRFPINDVIQGAGTNSKIWTTRTCCFISMSTRTLFKKKHVVLPIFSSGFMLGTIATCVFDMELNHKQASSALFFSLTRIKVGFLARGLRQKVLESSHGDGFFSRISTRKF